MAISNVQNSTDAITQATQKPSNQQQTTAATAQANQARIVQQQEQQRTQQHQQVAQTSKPVVNTQGQTTGKHVNTTA